MAIVDNFVNHAWYYAGIGALIGLMLDVLVIRKGLKAVLLFPLATGVMWLYGDAAQIAQKWSSADPQSPGYETHNCTTTGPDSPIVTGQNSVVVVNGKTITPGQSTDCAPASTSVSTHGAGSPIVTGAGAKVTVRVEQ